MTSKLSFCARSVYLDRRLIRFDERAYLPDIYASSRNLVLRASRQVEKSTFLANTILYEACMRPGIKILFVCPRTEQARVFSHTRLMPSIEESPAIRRRLVGNHKNLLQVTNMRFVNGSQLFIRAAFRSADAARGISSDLLLVDEFQDIAAGDLPVLQETLSHSSRGRTILTGTPKMLDNHLESMYRQSTAHEWTCDCGDCAAAVILDERCLGAEGVVCPHCRAPLDPMQGRWVARYPHATWGDGYWLNHLMVPWINYEEVLGRRSTYDLARFKNEVLGLPTTIGEHVVTIEELEACCGLAPMARSPADVPRDGQQQLVAGIDWGGGGTSRTVVVIGFMRSDYTFQICRFDRFSPEEDPQRIVRETARCCQHFQVRHIAADGGGNGHVYNRLLLEQLEHLNHLYAIFYSGAGQQPHQDGSLWKWTVDRSATIGALFSRVKNRQVLFPVRDQIRGYLDEFACEVAEYNDETRSVRYTHPETQQDDALHATNYALLIALRLYQVQHQY